MILRCFTVGLVICGSVVMQGAVTAQSQSLVLEDFQAKEADGFPSNWDHENQRSQSKGRDAYKIQTEAGVNFLAAKDAGQRIKKKKIDWDPKAFPVLTWRWRLQIRMTIIHVLETVQVDRTRQPAARFIPMGAERQPTLSAI